MRKNAAFLFLIVGVATAAPKSLTFIEDDFSSALEKAKTSHKLLFVDAWAPWCHSCLFLKEHVLNAPTLTKHEKQFVFLSIDTERPTNAAFLEKYPVDVWPTLYFIDPATGDVALKWVGTANVQQFEKLFNDVKSATRAIAAPVKTDANRQFREAAGHYAALNEKSKIGTRDVAAKNAIESVLAELYEKKNFEECTQKAIDATKTMNKGPSYASAASWGVLCVDHLDGEKKTESKKELLSHVEKALKDKTLLADDTSGLYEMLVDAKDEANDLEGKRKFAKEWLQFLEREASKSKTASQRAAFDPHLVNAAIALAQPLRAEAALKKSEKDFPSDYNPPARLALIYKDAGKLSDAQTSIESALTKVYGPRKLRIYEVKASIEAARGDSKAQIQTLKEAVAYFSQLPKSQQPKSVLTRIVTQLEKLEPQQKVTSAKP